MKNLLIAALATSLLVNVFFIIRSLQTPNPNSSVPAPNKEVSDTEFPYLSKRIFAENQNDLLVNFIPLRTALKSYTQELPEEVGIYFEYLPSGTSIGINDTMEINLASLVKIPVVMGIYREIDAGRIKKDDIIVLREEDLDQRFGDLWKRGAGAEITVKEAIDLSLIESDNTASTALLAKINGAAIDHVFDSLDIPKNTEGKYHIISPKSYSSILRSLYLSSYLSKESSNEILDILSRTKFNDKIAAGLPSNIKVSHKIGVFRSADNPEETYGDCGIIYIPNRPYLLCIMTKTNEEKAREYMSHISEIVYEYILAVKSAKAAPGNL